jgi:SH3-like domain-containing protein
MVKKKFKMLNKKLSIYPLILLSLLFVVLMIDSSSALCVKVETANLRSGPGTRYEKTWQVFKYMPLKKLKKKGKWYRVQDVDGDTHWIYAPLVANRYYCAVVKKDKVNVRTGPGTKYRKAHWNPAIKYDSFKVIRFKGKWVKVLDEFGQTGWIYKKLLWIQK